MPGLAGQMLEASVGKSHHADQNLIAPKGSQARRTNICVRQAARNRQLVHFHVRQRHGIRSSPRTPASCRFCLQGVDEPPHKACRRGPLRLSAQRHLRIVLADQTAPISTQYLRLPYVGRHERASVSPCLLPAMPKPRKRMAVPHVSDRSSPMLQILRSACFFLFCRDGLWIANGNLTGRKFG